MDFMTRYFLDETSCTLNRKRVAFRENYSVYPPKTFPILPIWLQGHFMSFIPMGNPSGRMNDSPGDFFSGSSLPPPFQVGSKINAKIIKLMTTITSSGRRFSLFIVSC
jgi:hypothetical protein